MPYFLKMRNFNWPTVFNFSHENDAVFYVLSMLKQLNISGKIDKCFCFRENGTGINTLERAAKTYGKNRSFKKQTQCEFR